jgi:HEAT repeat protein
MILPGTLQSPLSSAPDEARSIVNALLIAVKTHSLYPEDHTTCREALARLDSELQAFLASEEELLLQVHQDRLLCRGEVVLAEPPQEGSISFVLFRDGVQWFRFERGIDPWEIFQFVRIVDQYRYLPQESAGDIATALWEAQLPHVSYQVADPPVTTKGEEAGAPDGEQQEPPTTQVPPISAMRSPQDMAEEEFSAKIAAPQLLLPTLDRSSLQLSAREVLLLQEMISEEEARDPTGDILDMLTDILRLPTDQEFFVMVLEYLQETLRDTLDRRDVRTGFAVVSRLKQIREMCQDDQAWALAAIDGFFGRVSGPDFLPVFSKLWSTLGESDLERLQKILLFLTPEAIHSLAPLLPALESPRIAEMLTEVLCGLARRDLTPLERLIPGSGEDLLAWIARILGALDDERSGAMLLALVRHPSVKVRGAVINAVISRELWIPRDLFHLVEDENRYIRQKALRYLGSRRCATSEDLLLHYLENRNPGERGRAHLLACFRALGRCGSSRSIPFLRESLREKGWLSRVRGSSRRQAAAIALRELDLDEARGILEAAVRSPNSGVRDAVRAVFDHYGGTGGR